MARRSAGVLALVLFAGLPDPAAGRPAVSSTPPAPHLAPSARERADGGAARPVGRVPSHPYPLRGIIERDSSPSGFAYQRADGFNLIDSGPYVEDLDPLLEVGIGGFIWLGNYDNDRCLFENSESWIRDHVRAIAHHDAVRAYYIADEPDAEACPSAPTQIRARSALVKSIDPEPPTFVVLYKVEQFKLFTRTTDVMTIDIYPCSWENGCVYSKIDDAVAEVDRLGVRYWAMIQAHGDDWYRQPTPQELHREFLHWRASNMENYFVFSWKWPPDDPSLWLEDHPELLRQLKLENAIGPTLRE